MAEPGLDSAADLAPSAEQDKQAQSRRRVAFVIVAIALAILVWWIISHIAVVPSTIGMSSTRARSLLKFAGFETSVTLVPTEDKLSGRVVLQAPARGLYLTWWPVRVTVGANALSAGYTENDVTFFIDTGDSGLEVPQAGSASVVMPTDPEEVLALYYPPRTWDLLMPNVQNMTESQAVAAVKAVGMHVTTKRGPSTTDVKKGRVYYQKPAPGSGIESGQTAVLWVSDGSFSVLSGPWTGFPYPRPPSQYGE
jgi:PASTA domain